MAARNEQYTRMPGRARRRLSGLGDERGSLYLADDHLLYLVTSGYVERPHLFYLRDIRAISIQRTREVLHANAILAAVAALGWAPMTLLSWWADANAFDLSEAVYFYTIAASGLSAVAALAILVNLALGPRCVFRIHTGATTAAITPLSRLRTAQRVRDLLAPRIRDAQEPAAGPAAD